MDWITGNKFMEIADFTYSPPVKHQDDYYNLANTLDLNRLKDVNVVFTTPFYVNQLLKIINPLKEKFILITHNGDNRINPDGVVFLDGAGRILEVRPYVLSDNIIKWHAQNVNTIDLRIDSIPIGLENDGNKWRKHMRKKEKMLAKMQEVKQYKNLVYMNHTIRTNFKEREKPYEILEFKPFVDAERCTNGDDFDKFIDNIYNHKFVVCPEGNGVDTHRTWECLYMYTIPIEKKNLNNRFYHDLPICFVDDWEQVTEEFLDKEWTRIQTTTWYRGKLNFNYWKTKIMDGITRE
jgi:hypothetical protein